MKTSWLTSTFRSGLAATLVFACLALPARADSYSKIILSNDFGPFHVALSRNFKVLRLNDVAGGTFEDRDSKGGYQILARVNGRLTPVVRTGMRMPDQGLLQNIVSSNASYSGFVVFRGHTDKGDGIFIWGGGVIRKIAGDGTAYGQALLSEFGDPVVNDRGDVAFTAATLGNDNTDEDVDGVFLASPTANNYLVRRIAYEGGPAPGGGTFNELTSALAISQTPAGLPVVAFANDTTGGSGVYLGNASGMILLTRDTPTGSSGLQMNRVGQVVIETSVGITVGSLTGITYTVGDQSGLPNGDTLRNVTQPSLNDHGDIAFVGTTSNFQDGVFTARFTGGVKTLKIIKLEDQTFNVNDIYNFSQPQINSVGVIAFAGQIRKSGGTQPALFLSDGLEVVTAISSGDALLSDFVAAPNVSTNVPAPAFRPHSFNARGELAFTATLRDSGNAGVFLFTPNTRLLDPNDGIWDHTSNWRLGILPGSTSDVVLASATDLQMLGPSKSTVLHSLTVGGGGGTVTLKLQPGTFLTVFNGTDVLARATLTGSAILSGRFNLEPGSRLLLTLGGKTRGLYDFLSVPRGAVTLGGALEVVLAPGYTIPRDAAYDLLDLKSPKGFFSAAPTLPPLVPAGLFWDQSHLKSLGKIVASGATFFTQDAGVYSGLLQAAVPTPATSGSFVLTLMPDGRFRAVIHYAGTTYPPIAGRLELDGSAILKFGRPARQVTVQLDIAGHTGTMTGQVLENAAVVSMVSARSGPSVLPVGSPLIGQYTFALPADPAHPVDPAHPELAAPQGTGYGTISVSKAGLVRLAGTAGDGTVISAGGPLTATGEFSVYIPLYAKTGYLYGTITLASATAGTAFTAQLHWFKPAIQPPNPAKLFGAGFAVDPTLIGSGYEGKPHVFLNFAGGQATFDATGADLAAAVSKPVTLDANNHFKANNGESFALSFAPTHFGVGSGHFLDAAGHPHTFTSVVLQQQNEVLGLLRGTTQTGTVEVH